jgi:hypothetical protein
MALIADDAQDRAEQLLVATERLTALIAEEARRIQAREPLLDGNRSEEKNRLANVYRTELARIKQDRSLIEDARPETLTELRLNTIRLHEALEAHEIALSAVKTVTEGLVQAIAEEAVRQRGGAAPYGAAGEPVQTKGPIPAILDRSA